LSCVDFFPFQVKNIPCVEMWACWLLCEAAKHPLVTEQVLSCALCVCLVRAVGCHLTGKTLNLCDQLEHLLCRFSTQAVDCLPRRPMLHLPHLARFIAGLHARGIWQCYHAMLTCWPATTPRNSM
jgi:hypothetical protein